MYLRHTIEARREASHGRSSRDAEPNARAERAQRIKGWRALEAATCAFVSAVQRLLPASELLDSLVSLMQHGDAKVRARICAWASLQGGRLLAPPRLPLPSSTHSTCIANGLAQRVSGGVRSSLLETPAPCCVLEAMLAAARG